MTANRSFHLKSMTAFGRGVSEFSFGRFTVEIQSVNRRHLEVNVGLARPFVRFEMEIRKQVATCIGRGMISVSVSWKPEAQQPVSITPNLAFARAFNRAWEQLALELDLERSVPLELLAQNKDLFLYDEELVEEELYQKALSAALQEALDALLRMKEREGENHAADFIGRLHILEKEIALIEAYSADSSEKYRRKLTSKLEELFERSSENEERVLREIAVYAERVDTTEEIIRFKSHLEQFKSTIQKPLESPTETRGKTLEFLLQELLRESNTIGSKVSDLASTQHIVVIKSELERMRELVQNIE